MAKIKVAHGITAIDVLMTVINYNNDRWAINRPTFDRTTFNCNDRDGYRTRNQSFESRNVAQV